MTTPRERIDEALEYDDKSKFIEETINAFYGVYQAVEDPATDLANVYKYWYDHYNDKTAMPELYDDICVLYLDSIFRAALEKAVVDDMVDKLDDKYECYREAQILKRYGLTYSKYCDSIMEANSIYDKINKTDVNVPDVREYLSDQERNRSNFMETKQRLSKIGGECLLDSTYAQYFQFMEDNFPVGVGAELSKI
jgi:hypothetical protein